MRQNTLYLLLALILIALSAAAAYYFLYPYRDRIIPDIGFNIANPTPVYPPTGEPTDEPTGGKPTSTLPSTIPTSTKVKPPLKVTATPTPTTRTITSSVDNFTLTYNSYRKLYQDEEFSGNRYTLYSSQGNIAVHVGKIWSWTHPGRVFTSDLLVAGQQTFIYQINSQTIVDFQYSGKNYTIQCVHNGLSSIKTECDQLIGSFQLTATSQGS